ncbi:MAG: S1C family serine protease [Steroidobacterales bacterium]
MNTPSMLQQWSRERAQLAAALTPHAVALALARHRSLSGIHWRGPFIVTAAEALAGSDEVAVISEHGTRRASVVACDLATDVAVLRTEADDNADRSLTKLAAPASGAELEAGGGVIIVGRAPRGALIGFGSVRVAGPAWRSRRGGSIARRLEFEAVLDDRFEGALVADLTGLAAAMLVPGPRGSLLGIPAATVERIVLAVEQHGYLPRPFLGLRLQALWLDEATRGRWGRKARSVAAVAGIESGSPAEAAGLAPGDLLEAIDGVALDDVEAFAAEVSESSPGRVLELRLRRGGQPQTLQITVAQWRRPAH